MDISGQTRGLAGCPRTMLKNDCRGQRARKLPSNEQASPDFCVVGIETRALLRWQFLRHPGVFCEQPTVVVLKGLSHDNLACVMQQGGGKDGARVLSMVRSHE